MATNVLSSRYNLGPVKPWVKAAAETLGSMFGIGTIYGWRKTDPFPDHPSGHAVDFMTDIPNGQKLTSYAIANADALGIKYIIHNRQVWNPQQGWHPYTSTDNPHTDHVHITFLDTPGSGFNGASFDRLSSANGAVGTRPSGLPGVAVSTCAWELNVGSFYGCLATKTQVRGFVGGLMIAAGAVVGLFGIFVLTQYALNKTDAGKAAVSTVGLLAGKTL